MGVDCTLIARVSDKKYIQVFLDRYWVFQDPKNPFPFMNCDLHGNPNFSSDFESAIKWCYSARDYYGGSSESIQNKEYAKSFIDIVETYLTSWMQSGNIQSFVLCCDNADDFLLEDGGVEVENIYV